MNTGHTDDTDQTGEDAAGLARLVEQAQSGDRMAFHQLVERFQALIFRTLYYRTHSRVEAEDLTQDVFLRAYKNLPRLKSPLLFRSWLYRIAINRVRDYYRRKKLKTMLGFASIDDEAFEKTPAPVPFEAKAIQREAFWAHIREMMGAMSRLEKEVFYLRFFDELSIKEIATVMKKNESTVKTHLYRALAKVKSTARLDDLMEEL